MRNFDTSVKRILVSVLKNIIETNNFERLFDFYFEQFDTYKFYLHNFDEEKIKKYAHILYPFMCNKTIYIYRGIATETYDEIEQNEKIGNCWTYDKDIAIQFTIKLANIDDLFTTCIFTAKCDIENIDWVMSILLNSIEPNEKEIRIYKPELLKNIKIEFDEY